MANFATHLKASVISSSAVTSIILLLEILPITQVLGLFILGCLAGLIPDLDSDKSQSLNSLFTIFALIISALLVIYLKFESLLETWIVLLLVYGFIMLMIKSTFEHFTVHRGSFHSITAAILVTVTTINLALWLKLTHIFATLAAIYVFVGIITHLVLDECYSVDIDNKELKASFGTALKLIDTRYIIATASQFILILINIYLLWDNIDNLYKNALFIKEALNNLKLLPNVNKYI